MAVFRHKDSTQEFEVLPNAQALADRDKARAQVGNRWKKIKERVKSALGKRKAVPSVASMPADDDDDDDDDDGGDKVKWACEIATMRLLKRAKKDHLAALCGAFGVPVSGTKQELAENLAEQLHYETAEEEGSDVECHSAA